MTGVVLSVHKGLFQAEGLYNSICDEVLQCMKNVVYAFGGSQVGQRMGCMA